MKCSVSYLKSNDSLEKTIEKINATDADFIHVDIMDGKFVPNKTIRIEDTIVLLKKASKNLDIHLMVANPMEYIEPLTTLNTSYITFHIELQNDIENSIQMIHNNGIRAGLAINPETPVTLLEPYLEQIDYVLIMGVSPGKGGQKLITETLHKIEELKKIRKNYNYHYIISLDGGVNQETRPLLDDLDIVVAGSFICMSDNYQEKINLLR